MIRTKRVQQTLYITITGRIHLPLAYELTEALIGVAESCSEYRLDLGAATDISDGGLAVPALFANRSRPPGRVVPLTRISRTLACRLATMPVLHQLLVPHDAPVGDAIVVILPAERQRRDTRAMRGSATGCNSAAADDSAAVPLRLRHGTLH